MVAISLLLPGLLLADNWHWLQLCKHQTGEPKTGMRHQGIRTHGAGWIDLEQVTKMMPIVGVNCTLLEFRGGTQAAVIGSPKSLWCMSVGGPGCGDE